MSPAGPQIIDIHQGVRHACLVKEFGHRPGNGGLSKSNRAGNHQLRHNLAPNLTCFAHPFHALSL